jgi:hypothetical protein
VKKNKSQRTSMNHAYRDSPLVAARRRCCDGRGGSSCLRQRGRKEVAIKVDDFPQSAFTTHCVKLQAQDRYGLNRIFDMQSTLQTNPYWLEQPLTYSIPGIRKGSFLRLHIKKYKQNDNTIDQLPRHATRATHSVPLTMRRSRPAPGCP